MSKKKDFSALMDAPIITPLATHASAPISRVDLSTKRAEVRDIQVDIISPNPEQPRRYFNNERLNELAASIRERGVLQPISVFAVGDGTFQIIFGERRWRAASIAGLPTVPCIVRDRNTIELAEIALIENEQRENLLPEEVAVCVTDIMQAKKLTQVQMATEINKSQGAIARLCKIAEFVRNPAVTDFLEQWRADGKDVSAEILYMAATKGHNEGIEFIRNISGNGKSVMEARKNTQSPIKAQKWRREFAPLSKLHKQLRSNYFTKLHVVIEKANEKEKELLNELVTEMKAKVTTLEKLIANVR